MSDERKTAESAAVTELRVQVGILGERVFGIDKNLGTRIEALMWRQPILRRWRP